MLVRLILGLMFNLNPVLIDFYDYELNQIKFRESRNMYTVISKTEDFGIAQINIIHWNRWGINPYDYVEKRNGVKVFTMHPIYQEYYVYLLAYEHEQILRQQLGYSNPYLLYRSWEGIQIAINIANIERESLKEQRK